MTKKLILVAALISLATVNVSNQVGSNSGSGVTQGSSGSSAITGGTCTNQVVTAINSSGVPTCTTVTTAYGVAGYPGVYVAKTGSYNAVAYDDIDCTAACTITLPASSSNTNKFIVVTNSSLTDNATVSRTGSDVIGNQTETGQTLPPGWSYTFVASGTTLWRIH